MIEASDSNFDAVVEDIRQRVQAIRQRAEDAGVPLLVVLDPANVNQTTEVYWSGTTATLFHFVGMAKAAAVLLLRDLIRNSRVRRFGGDYEDDDDDDDDDDIAGGA